MSFGIAGTDEALKDGTTYIHHAADLWSLVDPHRGEAIRRWLRDEWTARDDDPDIEVYELDSLGRLLDLVEGLGDALRAQLTDRDYRIDADTAARISAREPTLIDSWKEDGRDVYTLTNRVGEVDQMVGLVKRAIALGRSVEVG